MRKTVTAAAMAASLTVGGAAGAALFVPTISGAQTDDTTTTEPADEADPERGDFLAEALAPLVEDGTIDQAQADAVIEAIREARPDGPRHRGPGARILGGALTDVLGMTGDELRAALSEGQTIAEVAEAQGVPVDDVIAALVAEAEERIDSAVENGRLTDDEAAEKLADATEHLTDLVNGDFEPGDHRGHRGGRGGPGSGPAVDDGSADDTTGS